MINEAKKPKALDLFCKAGGASMGLHRAGFNVTGVDIEPQPRYPFRFIQADALTFDLSGFDFIWASPPCQHNLYGLNAVNRARGRTVNHADLIPQTRKRLVESGKPYIIENIKGARLHFPVRLCGSSFGLPIFRHRYFESSHALFALPCEHWRLSEAKYPTNFRPGGRIVKSKVVQAYGNTAGSHLWPEALGIDWMKRDELAQAIPPAYSEYLGRQMLDAIPFPLPQIKQHSTHRDAEGAQPHERMGKRT